MLSIWSGPKVCWKWVKICCTCICSLYDVALFSREVKKIIVEKGENAGSHSVFNPLPDDKI